VTTRYRHQVLRTLHHEGLPEFLALQRTKNELLAGAGLATYAVWAPAFGGLHHLVLEAEFGSMAEVEAHQVAARALEGYNAASTAQLRLVAQGTASDRLIKLSLPG
jgi:hypothetical protein